MRRQPAERPRPGAGCRARPTPRPSSAAEVGPGRGRRRCRARRPRPRPRPRPTTEAHGTEATDADPRRPPPRASTPRAARSTSSSRAPVVHHASPGSTIGEHRVRVRAPSLDGLSVADALHRHADLAARAHLLDGVPARATAASPTTTRSSACSPRRCSSTSLGIEHAPDARGLGAGRRLLVRAHRPLVGGARPTPTPPSRPSSPTASATSACIIGVIITFFAAGATSFNVAAHQPVRARRRAPAPDAAAGRRALPVRRRHVEVGPVPAAHLAARRHGRPDAGVGPHPRRHHGRGRRLPDRPPVPGVLRGPQHRRPLASTTWPSSAASPPSSAPSLAFVQTRHQEGAGLLDHQPARLHGHGPRRRRLDRRPSSTSSPTPCSRPASSSAPARSATPAHHTFDMREDGRPPQVHADHLLDLRHRRASRWPASSRFAGFWSKDEILAGALKGQDEPRTTCSCWSWACSRAFMTAAYMTRAYLPHLLRRVPRPRPPARVAQGHHRPADDPGRRRHRARLRQPARAGSRAATSPTPPLRALRRADVRLPDRSTTPSSTSCARPGLARVSSLLGVFIGLPVLRAAERARSPASPTAASAVRAGATGSSRTSTTSTALYTDVIVGVVQGPARPGHRTGSTRRSSTASSTAPASPPGRRRLRSTATSTRASSTRSSTAPAPAPRSPGQFLRRIQTGQVQQYAALLFGGAVVLGRASSSSLVTSRSSGTHPDP